MDYWAETMQDDVWMIVADGWKAMLNGKPNTDLIPPALIVARYFAAEQAAIEKLEAERDAISRQMEEMDEEHGGEEGLLAEAKTDKGKLTKASVKARLTEIKHDKEAADERKVLNSLRCPDRTGSRRRQEGEGSAEGARCQGGRPIRQAHRGRDQDPGGGGQMAGRAGRQRAGRTGSRVARRSPGASGNWPNATPRRCPG